MLLTNDFSKEIWFNTYKYEEEKDLSGTFLRNAVSIASVEKTEELREYWTQQFNDVLQKMQLCPAGRILANAGTHYKGTTLFNCYVGSRPSYDLDSLDGILETLRIQAQTLKSEGGWGMNFSFIRPRGSTIYGIGVETPGSIKYMELFNRSSDIITAGSGREAGKVGLKKKIRKGAQMGMLSVWHPDILEFITAKRVANRLDKFNVSVVADKKFMEKVLLYEESGQDSEWDFIFPETTHPNYKSEWDGNIYRWVDKGYPVRKYGSILVSKLWDLIMRSTFDYNDPGIFFEDRANATHLFSYDLDKYILCTNPCQPAWATVLTPNGISTLKDINIGDLIWSEKGWTKVVNKVCTGNKDVYAYKTTFGTFYGTENHKVLENGEKIEAKSAEGIDILRGGYNAASYICNPKIIMDGLVFGDGSVHKASNNLVHLNIGKDDQDYFDSSISNYIGQHRPGLHEYSYEIKTDILPEELPHTYARKIPDRYFYGDKLTVRSFLKGLYSANGSVTGGRVTLKASSYTVISQVQIMLSSLGIASYYTVNKPNKIKFSNGEYECKKSYDLNITRDKHKFWAIIGFLQKYKQDKLYLLIKNKCDKPEVITKDIHTIEFVGNEDVYDITVDNVTHTYWTGGLNVSNCGEQSMPYGSVCDLASIPLPSFYKNGIFDYVEFERAVRVAVRLLDNVNDYSSTPHESYTKSARENRRIGLGLMGWASLLYLMKVRFGSDEAEAIKHKLMKTFTSAAVQASIDLAIEKGPFTGCDKEKLADHPFWDQIELDAGYREAIRKHGLRNSALFSIQPNGNTGVLMNLMSGGAAEPIFMHEYIRTVIVQPAPEHIKDRCPKYEQGEFHETDLFKFTKEGSETILKGTDETGVTYKIDKNRGLTKEVLCEDYAVKKLKEIGEWDSEAPWAVTTTNLSVEDHIKDLKGWAKWIDSAISKTVNIPNDYSYEDFKKIYLEAYKTGVIKGITTYRAGTMTSVLSAKMKDKIYKTNAPKRPRSLPCKVFYPMLRGQRYYVVCGLYEDDLYEVFAGKLTECIPHSITEGEIVKVKKGHYRLINNDDVIIDNLIEHCDHSEEAICRLMSAGLRHGTDVKFLKEQLSNCKGELYSFGKVLGRILGKFIPDNTLSNELCPDCGKNLVFTEGCKGCTGDGGCGWSKCS